MGIWGHRYTFAFLTVTSSMTAIELFAAAGSSLPSGSGTPLTQSTTAKSSGMTVYRDLGCAVPSNYFGSPQIYPDVKSGETPNVLYAIGVKDAAKLPAVEEFARQSGAIGTKVPLSAVRMSGAIAVHLPLSLEQCTSLRRSLAPSFVSPVPPALKHSQAYVVFDANVCGGWMGKGSAACEQEIRNQAGEGFVFIGQNGNGNYIFAVNGKIPPGGLSGVPGYLGSVNPGSGPGDWPHDSQLIVHLGLSDMSIQTKEEVARILITQYLVPSTMVGDMAAGPFGPGCGGSSIGESGSCNWTHDTSFIQVVVNLAQLSELGNIARVSSIQVLGLYGDSYDPLANVRELMFGWLLSEPDVVALNRDVEDWRMRPAFNFQTRASGLISLQGESRGPINLDGSNSVVGVSDWFPGFLSANQVNASLVDGDRFSSTNDPYGCNEPSSCNLSYAHTQSVMSVIGASHHQNESAFDEDPDFSTLRVGRGSLPRAAMQFNSFLVTDMTRYGLQVAKMTNVNSSQNGYRPANVISKAWGNPSAGVTTYTPMSQMADEWVVANPTALFVQSVGNQGTAPGIYAQDAMMKNSLTVGAVRHSNTLVNVLDDLSRLSADRAAVPYGNPTPSTPSYGLAYDESIVGHIVSYTDGLLAANGPGSQNFVPFYHSSAAAAAVAANAAAVSKLFATANPAQAPMRGYFNTALDAPSGYNGYQLTAVNAPHAATLKALMIHSAEAYGISQMDRGTQGFGAAKVTAFSQNNISKFRVIQGNRSGATGTGVLTGTGTQQNIPITTISYPSLVGARKIKITLVWTDAAFSSPGGTLGYRLVNNLDLTALLSSNLGGATYKGNCGFLTGLSTPPSSICNTADSVNNVEQIVIDFATPIPANSSFTVSVRAAALLVDMTPAAGYNTPYSLVMSWE